MNRIASATEAPVYGASLRIPDCVGSDYHSFTERKPYGSGDKPHTVSVSKANELKSEDIKAHERRGCKRHEDQRLKHNLLKLWDLSHLCAYRSV